MGGGRRPRQEPEAYTEPTAKDALKSCYTYSISKRRPKVRGYYKKPAYKRRGPGDYKTIGPGAYKIRNHRPTECFVKMMPANRAPPNTGPTTPGPGYYGTPNRPSSAGGSQAFSQTPRHKTKRKTGREDDLGPGYYLIREGSGRIRPRGCGLGRKWPEDPPNKNVPDSIGPGSYENVSPKLDCAVVWSATPRFKEYRKPTPEPVENRLFDKVEENMRMEQFTKEALNEKKQAWRQRHKQRIEDVKQRREREEYDRNARHNPAERERQQRERRILVRHWMPFLVLGLHANRWLKQYRFQKTHLMITVVGEDRVALLTKVVSAWRGEAKEIKRARMIARVQRNTLSFLIYVKVKIKRRKALCIERFLRDSRNTAKYHKAIFVFHNAVRHVQRWWRYFHCIFVAQKHLVSKQWTTVERSIVAAPSMLEDLPDVLLVQELLELRRDEAQRREEAARSAAEMTRGMAAKARAARAKGAGGGGRRGSTAGAKGSTARERRGSASVEAWGAQTTGSSGSSSSSSSSSGSSSGGCGGRRVSNIGAAGRRVSMQLRSGMTSGRRLSTAARAFEAGLAAAARKPLKVDDAVDPVIKEALIFESLFIRKRLFGQQRERHGTQMDRWQREVAQIYRLEEAGRLVQQQRKASHSHSHSHSHSREGEQAKVPPHSHGHERLEAAMNRMMLRQLDVAKPRPVFFRNCLREHDLRILVLQGMRESLTKCRAQMASREERQERDTAQLARTYMASRSGADSSRRETSSTRGRVPPLSGKRSRKSPRARHQQQRQKKELDLMLENVE